MNNVPIFDFYNIEPFVKYVSILSLDQQQKILETVPIKYRWSAYALIQERCSLLKYVPLNKRTNVFYTSKLHAILQELEFIRTTSKI